MSSRAQARACGAADDRSSRVDQAKLDKLLAEQDLLHVSNP